MTDPDDQQIADIPEEWTVLDSSTPFVGKVTALRSDQVRMPDGNVSQRDYQTHSGSVGILPMDSHERVLVLRQYRHPVRRRLWEAPAGLLDVSGEAPLHAAQRELREETHHQAGDWRVLVDYYSSPGALSEAIRLYLARDLSELEGARFEAEGEELDMAITWVPLDQLVRLALQGELHNPTLLLGTLAVRAARDGDGLDALRPADATWQR